MCIWGASKNSCSFFGVGEVEVDYCGMVVGGLVVVCSVSNVYSVSDEAGCGKKVVNSTPEFRVFCSVSIGFLCQGSSIEKCQ